MASDMAADISVNAGSRLASLPEELISNIAGRLGSDNIFNFRLACRDVEAKSVHEFATDYLSSKCFIFSSESLNTLLGIARSEKLRGYLHDVYILSARFLPRDSKRPCAKCCGHSRLSVRHSEAHKFYVTDQKQLREGGRDKQMLIAAFRELTKMTSLTLVDSVASLPTLTDCSGMNKYTRTANMPLVAAPLPSSPYGPRPLDRTDEEYMEWLTYVWKTTMEAVGEAGVSTIEHLSTKIIDPMYQLSPLKDFIFPGATLKQLSVALSNLKTVDLSVRSYYLRKGRTMAEPKDFRLAAKRIRTFAQVLRSASDVGLTFEVGEPQSGELCAAFFAPLDLTKLEAVRMESAAIDAKSLGKIITGAKNLKKVFLSHLDLAEGRWVTILRALKGLTNLNHLHLMYLSEAMAKAYFLTQPENPEDFEVSYSPTMSEFLAAAGEEDDDEDDDDDDEDYGESDDDDDEMPGLISQDGVPRFTGMDAPPPLTTSGGPPPENAATSSGTPPKQNLFQDSRHCHDPARGYYVCLGTSEEIAEYLPIFIKEYNTGDPTYVDGGIPPGPLPAGLNQMFTSIMGGVGGQIAGGAGTFTVGMGPMPGPAAAPQAPPGPPDGAGHAGTAAGGGGGAQAQGPGGLGLGHGAMFGGTMGAALGGLTTLFGPPATIAGNAQAGHATFNIGGQPPAAPVQGGGGVPVNTGNDHTGAGGLDSVAGADEWLTSEDEFD